MPTIAQLLSTYTENDEARQLRHFVGVPGVNLKEFGPIVPETTLSRTKQAAVATAFNAFGTYARAESAAGRGVVLFIDPGIYNFDMRDCQGALLNIKNLVVIAYGVTFNNVYTGDNPWFRSAATIMNPEGVTTAKRINATAVGDDKVVCTTAADAAAFVVGEPVMITSVDTQYSGYPPNADQIEFHVPTRINATGSTATVNGLSLVAGAVSFAPVIADGSATYFGHVPTVGSVIYPGSTLEYAHRTDYADPTETADVKPIGKARIWPMKAASAYPVPSVGALTDVTWDVDHTFIGMTLLADGQAANYYQTVLGRRVKFIHCKGVGPSPSMCEIAEFEDFDYHTAGEPDKLCKQVNYRRGTFRGDSISQSSSINVTNYEDVVVSDLLVCGSKITNFTGGKIGQLHLQNGNAQGMSRLINIRGTEIIGAYNGPILTVNIPTGGGSASDMAIEGISGSAQTVTFSNGTITVPKNLAAALLSQWNMIPGQHFCIQRPDGYFTGPSGTAMVTRVYDDSNNIYYVTTLASLPTWATASGTSDVSIRLQKQGIVRITNCRGSAFAKTASAAGRRDLAPWDYWEDTLVGSTAGGTIGLHGELIKMVVNVVKTTSFVASPRMTLYESTSPQSDPSAARTVFSAIFDLGVAGERIYDQRELIGKTANDTLTQNAVAQTTLPTGRWHPYDSALTLDLTSGLPGAGRPDQLPVVTIQLWYSQGTFFDLVPSGIGGVTGQLP